MNNAELIKQLRGCKDIEFCTDCPRMPNGIIEPCDIKDAAADALEVADKRIAELMPKEGEWIATSAEVDGSRFTGERCSRCGWWKSMGIYHYCPNCGARMKGEHDEQIH